MNDIDRQIREALEAEDRELFDKLDEPSLPGQVIESFRTRSRWLIAGSILAGIFMMGVCVVSGIRLAQAEEPRALVHWATVEQPVLAAQQQYAMIRPRIEVHPDAERVLTAFDSLADPSALPMAAD